MAEVAPSAGGGGGNRNFLLIIGGLAALFIIGALIFGGIIVLPGLLGGNTNVAAVTATPTRISIPPTPTRTPQPSQTVVVSNESTPVPEPTLQPGARLMRVSVGENKAVTLTVIESAKETLVQKGTWAYDAATHSLTLSFTELNGQPFKDQIVFTLEGNQLKPVAYNKALHGDLSSIQIERTGSGAPQNYAIPKTNSGLARPAAQATATPSPGGDYAGTIPPPPPGERLMELYLGADNTAVLGTLEDGQNSILQLGTWKADGNKVTVNLTIKDGQPFEEVLSLELQDNKLVGTTTNPDLHGAAVQFAIDPSAPELDAKLPAGTYQMALSLNATPIPITATPIAITATPEAGATTTSNDQLPKSGLGEDLLMLFGGGLLLLGIIVVVRRMRTN